MSLKVELNNIADEANKESLEEAFAVLEAKFRERAAAGCYDYKFDVRREYLPRVISKFVNQWKIGYQLLGTYKRGPVVMYGVLVFWSHDEEEKPIGFNGASG